MKKGSIIILCVLALLIALAIIPQLSSSGVSEPQAVRNTLAQDSIEQEQDAMSRERYVDSLINVASGKEGVTLKANREHALKILRQMYPEESGKWDRMQTSIDNMEMY